MIIFVNISILICLFLLLTKFIATKSSVQKIIGFYLTFSQLIMLILFNSISKFEYIVDMVLLLFLLELAAVLLLLLNKKL